MRSIRVLDCTLRDGGYCNQWKFGEDNIKNIISGLVDADVDIIECGFLTERVEYNPDISKYPSLDKLERVLPECTGKQLVVMINYGEYNPDNLPKCKDAPISGIRLAFHKKNMVPALEQCEILKRKGYNVFVQAMVSMSYTDKEFLDLIDRVNQLSPYAFYIVDSFGMMKGGDLARFASLIDHNLNEEIYLGFHSHNNLQLAYSNALELIRMRGKRDIIIDSSIYGMGRGAGNLNTELFLDYLNSNCDGEYDIRPVLGIMDRCINNFYRLKPWGYSLPNYLSATHNAHPNYAGYFSERDTLTVEAMDQIFDMMDEDKRFEYDAKYAEEIYYRYMESGKISSKHHEVLMNVVTGKAVLLIGPAKSALTERDRIIEFAERDGVIVVSVNFDYPSFKTDFIFISNLRRFKELKSDAKNRSIVTSNISTDEAYTSIPYLELLNDAEAVRDNSGLMAIKYFSGLGAKEIILAGFDGYSEDFEENYAESQMAIVIKKATLNARNDGMSKVLSEYSKSIKIRFLTAPVHYLAEGIEVIER